VDDISMAPFLIIAILLGTSLLIGERKFFRSKIKR
jgi:hypothetical protein